MTKYFLAIVISVVGLISCSTAKKEFGKAIIKVSADTIKSKELVVQIKKLGNKVFDSAIFFGAQERQLRYRLFKPMVKDAQNTDKFPLVVVYHSSGPIGTDNISQLGILPKLFASQEIQTKYPAYVLAPQFPTRSSDYVIDSQRMVLYSVPRPCLYDALQLIDSLKSVLNIDAKRIYAIGFSMGGSTVINSLSARPELFAAGISIAGIPQFDKIQDLAQIPIWLIHGMDDTENPINSDEQFYTEKAKLIRFWKLRATTHNNVFTEQLLGEKLPKWLFKQHKE